LIKELIVIEKTNAVKNFNPKEKKQKWNTSIFHFPYFVDLSNWTLCCHIPFMCCILREKLKVKSLF